MHAQMKVTINFCYLDNICVVSKNKTILVGSEYATDDCLKKCKCNKVNGTSHLTCAPLCSSSPQTIKCKESERVVDITEKVSSQPQCFCKNQQCKVVGN